MNSGKAKRVAAFAIVVLLYGMAVCLVHIRMMRWVLLAELLLTGMFWFGWDSEAVAAEPEPTTVESIERIVWNKTPIPITLITGTERLVSFPGEVRVGVPVGIQTTLRTQSTDGTVYWTASEAFPTQRIQARDIATGEIVLIDLKAVEKDPAVPKTPIEIVLADRPAGPADSGAPAPAGQVPAVDYVTLTRHAATQLYAPRRMLADAPAGIFRAAVPRGNVKGLLRGLDLEFVPVGAWTGGGLYVTAIKVRNRSPEFVVLDPRLLRGAWLAATFQYVRLHPAGEEADTTALYLVSARPFREAF